MEEYKFTPKEIRQSLKKRCNQIANKPGVDLDILDLIYKIIEAMP